MRHLENRSLEKCLILYQLVNLKLFHPEQRNVDQNYMRFLDTREKLILRFKIVPISISRMPGKHHIYML